jgi:hypothetical protein
MMFTARILFERSMSDDFALFATNDGEVYHRDAHHDDETLARFQAQFVREMVEAQEVQGVLATFKVQSVKFTDPDLYVVEALFRFDSANETDPHATRISTVRDAMDSLYGEGCSLGGGFDVKEVWNEDAVAPVQTPVSPLEVLPPTGKYYALVRIEQELFADRDEIRQTGLGITDQTALRVGLSSLNLNRLREIFASADREHVVPAGDEFSVIDCILPADTTDTRPAHKAVSIYPVIEALCLCGPIEFVMHNALIDISKNAQNNLVGEQAAWAMLGRYADLLRGSGYGVLHNSLATLSIYVRSEIYAIRAKADGELKKFYEELLRIQKTRVTETEKQAQKAAEVATAAFRAQTRLEEITW